MGTTYFRRVTPKRLRVLLHNTCLAEIFSIATFPYCQRERKGAVLSLRQAQ